MDNSKLLLHDCEVEGKTMEVFFNYQWPTVFFTDDINGLKVEDIVKLQLDNIELQKLWVSIIEKLKGTMYPIEQNQWISIKDKYPEDKEVVLCLDEYWDYRVCITQNLWGNVVYFINDACNRHITHWIELPSKPPTIGEYSEKNMFI